MPIPDFDHNNVLPPHLNNPTSSVDLSPYPCTIEELCHKFSTSKERVQILKNLIAFRERMTQFGVVNGFQWLDGSFLENIEVSQRRAPRDLDIVTFYGGLSQQHQSNIMTNFPEFACSTLSKSNFLLDHYAVDYSYDPNVTVEYTRYWVQLFSHNRMGIWKGMLQLFINTPADDQRALAYLNSIQP